MSKRLLPALVLVVWVAPALAEYQLEIGPDTTVIDGPLNPDGTINYLAYLNEKLSEGVTPENNFAVDVAMVMRPAPHGWPNEAFRERVFDVIGIDKSDDGPFVTSIREFIGDGEAIEFDDPRCQAWHDVISNPWTAKDHPAIKCWLDSQNEVLDKISVGVRDKHRFYFPLLVKDDSVESFSNVLLPWLRSLRALGRGFRARAGLKIAEGDLVGVWSDVKTMQMMANLSMQEPLTLSWLVGVSIHSMASEIIEDIACSDRLTGELARQMIIDARQLSPLSPHAEAFDLGERLRSLDVILHYWKGRNVGYYGSPLDEDMLKRMQSDEFDPNVTMRAVNKWIDQWIQLDQVEPYEARISKADQYERVCEMLFQRALKLLEGDAGTRRLMRKEISASNETTAGITPIFIAYMFTNKGSRKAEAIINMKLALAPLALAIGGYQAQHGEYPPDLQALVPAFLDSLPSDFATGELPVYRIEDGAAIVYSLGTNLRDDGGVDDHQDGDIVFRIER